MVFANYTSLIISCLKATMFVRAFDRPSLPGQDIISGKPCENIFGHFSWTIRLESSDDDELTVRYVVGLFTVFRLLCWYRCGISPNNVCVRVIIIVDERTPFISSGAPVSNLILKVSTTGTPSKRITKCRKNLERRTPKYKKFQISSHPVKWLVWRQANTVVTCQFSKELHATEKWFV